MGHAFVHSSIRSCWAEIVLRGGLPSAAEAHLKFGEQFIRVYGDTAVNTGYYTLFYAKDGETKSIPARYSFTFVKEGNDCKIVDHHSSAMPAPPR